SDTVAGLVARLASTASGTVTAYTLYEEQNTVIGPPGPAQNFPSVTSDKLACVFSAAVSPGGPPSRPLMVYACTWSPATSESRSQMPSVRVAPVIVCPDGML